MPVGVYRVRGEGDRAAALEEFRCAPGPAGWRWFSTVSSEGPDPRSEVIDYAVDATWRPARLRIQTQEHRLVLVADAGRLVGERDGEPLEIPYREDLGYRSPVFNAVTANRLGRSGDVEALSLETETLRDRPERQRYELQGPERVATPVGAFEATVWRYTALETGWTARLCVAGDVVVAFEGSYELISYEPGPRGPFPS